VSNKDQVKPLFLPAGVAGPSKRYGYVADVSGAIEALDLSTGEQLWRTPSEAPSRPVMVIGSSVAVLRQAPDGKANVLQLVLLDTERDGEAVLESEPLIFPDWVQAAVVPGESFNYQVGLERNDLIVEWEAHARYRGGAPPPARILAKATKEAAASARIDLKTGRVEFLPSAGRNDIELPQALHNAMLFSYRMGPSDSWHTEPWAVGSDGSADKLANEFAVIAGEVLDELQALQLRKWNGSSGEISRAVSLVTGQALVSYVTPDGRYLFIHSEAKSESSPDNQQPWWVFSVVTGRQVSVLDYEQGTRQACVIDSHLYYLIENPPPQARTHGQIIQSTLKALDIVSGRLLWQLPLSEQRATRAPALRR
jgi:hypothetical protein